jgi:hypothetical protein
VLQNGSDNTKTLQFDLSGQTTSTLCKLKTQNSVAATINLPPSNCTLQSLDRTETISGQKTFSSNPIIQNELIFQSSSSANFFALLFSTPAANRNITLPDPGGNDSLAYLAATQTLTNKTLTNPTINSVSLTGNVLQGDVTTQTMSVVWTGPYTSSSVTVTYRLINGTVHVRLPSSVGSSSSATVMMAGTAFPSGYRPTVAQNLPFYVQTATSTYAVGVVTINTLGTMTIWNANFTNFAASGNIGYLDQCFSFPVF